VVHARTPTTVRKVKPFFKSAKDAEEYLLRTEAGEARYTREQVSDLTMAIEIGWIVASSFRLIAKIRPVYEILKGLEPRQKPLQVPETSRPRSMARLVKAASLLEPYQRWLLDQVRAAPPETSRIWATLKDSPPLDKHLRLVSGAVQMQAMFALLTVRELGCPRPQPAEMEALVLLSSIREAGKEVEFGPEAVSTRRRRTSWKVVLKNAAKRIDTLKEIGEGITI